MAIIPLDKLIEYKGNKFELTKAMIELARNGNSLLGAEAKYRGGKYVQTVVKNILDGNIKYAYEESSIMEIDPHAPFLNTESTGYNNTRFIPEVTEEESEAEAESDDNEKPKLKDAAATTTVPESKKEEE